MDESTDERIVRNRGSARRYPGLEQLICVALANPSFAERLVADAPIALHQLTHLVRLSPVEYRLAASVAGAADIYDYAARLQALCSGERPEPSPADRPVGEQPGK